MTKPNLQDRGQWTSASAAQYDALCPGRHIAQRGLPETENPDAESGTRIHEWLATPPSQRANLELGADELGTAEACAAIEETLLASWLDPAHTSRCDREKRMWIGFDTFYHSGKPDVVYVQGERALVLDYKTGRTDAPIPSSNMQLRDLAVLTAKHYGVREITVAIIQPWVTHKPEPCRYDFKDLARAMGDMEDRVVASNDPNAKRIPGEVQCKYCRAKSVCAEFAAASLPQPLSDSASGALDQAGQVAAAIQAMPGDRLGRFLGLVRLASDTAEQEVRARLAGGSAVNGWQLKPGRVTEKIVNAQAVFEHFVLMGGTTEQFMPAVTVGKTKLKEQVRAVTGAKGKGLDAKLAQVLEGATESKQGAPVLEAE